MALADHKRWVMSNAARLDADVVVAAVERDLFCMLLVARGRNQSIAFEVRR